MEMLPVGVFSKCLGIAASLPFTSLDNLFIFSVLGLPNLHYGAAVILDNNS